MKLPMQTRAEKSRKLSSFLFGGGGRYISNFEDWLNSTLVSSKSVHKVYKACDMRNFVFFFFSFFYNLAAKKHKE